MHWPKSPPQKESLLRPGLPGHPQLLARKAPGPPVPPTPPSTDRPAPHPGSRRPPPRPGEGPPQSPSLSLSLTHTRTHIHTHLRRSVSQTRSKPEHLPVSAALRGSKGAGAVPSPRRRVLLSATLKATASLSQEREGDEEAEGVGVRRGVEGRPKPSRKY